jgi:hypothetical protein
MIWQPPSAGAAGFRAQRLHGNIPAKLEPARNGPRRNRAVAKNFLNCSRRIKQIWNG